MKTKDIWIRFLQVFSQNWFNMGTIGIFTVQWHLTHLLLSCKRTNRVENRNQPILERIMIKLKEEMEISSKFWDFLVTEPEICAIFIIFTGFYPFLGGLGASNLPIFENISIAPISFITSLSKIGSIIFSSCLVLSQPSKM